jgi:hypothetical protein
MSVTRDNTNPNDTCWKSLKLLLLHNKGKWKKKPRFLSAESLTTNCARIYDITVQAALKVTTSNPNERCHHYQYEANFPMMNDLLQD